MMEEAPSNSRSTTPTTPGSVDDKPDEPTPIDATRNDTQETSTSTGSDTVPETTNSGAYSAGNWQAIWSPAHNAYYFYNSVTRETTWVNPLQQGQQQAGDSKGKGKEKATGETESEGDEAEGQDEDYEKQGNVPGLSTDATASTPALTQWEQMQANAIAQGIDPSLAHLDPSLAAGPSLPSEAFTARFNARTGAFTTVDGRDPSHLSEYERAKRMSQFYFDVGAWEKELEQRDIAEEERKKKRKPTKKDLDRFKEQKRQKKIAKTAWLRT
ncbi:hypothetical protein BDM02DRAFT_3121944 [Thelephora ganbajun]|uniref:Uncharacterized protein n=1 Tax=Thelephora ganbajun TaxID=370292 RepID=A0ACB6Z4V6_THEGA|nr:hypothetical protein BDM02DRAFT_3121944 [Thelephora ganbajun]